MRAREPVVALVPSPRVGKAVAVTDNTTERRRRPRSLGLRARVTVGLSLAGLVVSLGLSVITYSLARGYLLDQRDSVARTQAFLNASRVRDVLRANPSADLVQLVASIRTETGGVALLEVQDRWFSQNVGFNQQSLPTSLREAVISGESGRQRFGHDGEDYLAVGVHMPEPDANYFEVFPLGGVDSTLGTIGTSLAVAASFTALAAAGIGWWASRRLLRPLSRVADAAGDLATGGLDTRLEEENDPDLDRLVASFNEMADAVQSRIQREARFASDVSHELRSPLTALTAAVEVLDGRRDDLPPRSQQALDVVVSQTRRFDQMVLDLLELSRLDAGAADLLIEPIAVGNVMRRVAARYGAEDVPIDVQPPFDSVGVPLDKRRLERILANLIGNAEQHGGGAVRIAAERGPRGFLRIVVEDKGSGVAPEERARIFERFARGSAARHRVGTGLGLALVAEHAQLHGGRAWVEDRPGGGARFVVELPVVRP